MTDEQIIKMCLAGDGRSQRELFDRYYAYVYAIAHRYLSHHHDAEDVVSETFSRVYRSLSKIVDSRDGGVKRWIQRITINESLRCLKRKQPLVFVEDTSTLDRPVETSDKLESSLSRRAVLSAIDSLPDGYRVVFMLSAIDGLSHAEIADHLGISRNTSKSQMLKARKYLQNKLQRYEPR